MFLKSSCFDEGFSTIPLRLTTKVHVRCLAIDVTGFKHPEIVRSEDGTNTRLKLARGPALILGAMLRDQTHAVVAAAHARSQKNWFVPAVAMKSPSDSDCLR